MNNTQLTHLKNIEAAVCLEYGIKLTDLGTSSRRDTYSKARQTVVHMAYNLGLTNTELMSRYNRSHCLIYTYLNNVDNMLFSDNIYKQMYTAIKNDILCEHEFSTYICDKKAIKLCEKCNKLIRL